MADNSSARSLHIAYLTTVSITMRVLSGVAVGIMLLFLVPLLIPYITNAMSFGYVRTLLDAEQSISTFVRNNIPTVVAGKDVTRWIVVAGMFLLSGSFNRASEQSRDRYQFLKFRRDVDQWKSNLHLSDNAVILAPINTKLEQLRRAKKADRERLLQEFAETKRKLDEMGRDVAFLSIDIADSTGMKQGEERASIEHDFKEYKRFVERTLNAHGCLKSTWTPDGVMSAFTTVDAAVKAAREVIRGLEVFNRDVKTMRREFTVRCGVNSGFVYFDESIPLEEISDRVIDIAGHMQKHAKPNSVCVAKPAIEPLADRVGFEPAGRIIDGYEVYEWELRKS